MRTTLTATITLLAYFQAGVLSVFSSPVPSEYIPDTTVLSQTLDPYTQKHLRLEYAPANQAVSWSLVDQNNTLASESYSLGKDIQSVNIGTIYNGDHIFLAGQLTDGNWFIQLITSSGQKQWLHKESVPIYDMAFSQDGQFLYLVGGVDDFSAPLFLVMNSLTGDVVFRKSEPYDISDKEPGIYKQLVVTDSEEIVVAEHNSKGTLKLSKWKPASHTVQEFVRVKDFCESCVRTDVKSVAMEKGYLSGTAFDVMLYDNALEVILVDSTKGQVLKSQRASIIESAYWYKVSRFDGANLSSDIFSEKWLNLYLVRDNKVNLHVTGCQLTLSTYGLSSPRIFDFCEDYLSGGHKRKLLQVNATDESDQSQDEIPYPEQRAFMILEWVLGVVGLIEITLLGAGIAGIFTGVKTYFKEKKDEKDERITKSKERELLRRNKEGQLLNKFRKYDPLKDLFSSRVKMLPGTTGISMTGFEGVVLPDKESGGSCIHLHPMDVGDECDRPGLASQNNIMERYFTKLDLIKELFENASKGETEKVRDTIKKFREYINHPDDNGNTVLHFAVAVRKPEDSSGKQTIEHIRFLILHGADVEATNNYGLSPVMMAIQLGNITAFKELIRAPNISVESRSLLIHMVVRAETSNSTPYFEAILKRKLHSGINFHQVCKGRDWLRCDRASSVSSGGLTILHEAAIRGNYEIMRLIVENGLVSVDEADDAGNTALHYAVLHDYDTEYQAIKLLIKHNADSLATNDAGVTPLKNAEYRGVNEIVELLQSMKTDALQEGGTFELR